MLRVHCNDHEFEIAINADEMSEAINTEIHAREARIQVQDKIQNDTPVPLPTNDSQGYSYLTFLHCPFRSLEPIEWSDHCMDHFLLDEPAHPFKFTLCELKEIPITSPYTEIMSRDQVENASGWDLWNNYLQHIM